MTAKISIPASLVHRVSTDSSRAANAMFSVQSELSTFQKTLTCLRFFVFIIYYIWALMIIISPRHTVSNV